MHVGLSVNNKQKPFSARYQWILTIAMETTSGIAFTGAEPIVNDTGQTMIQLEGTVDHDSSIDEVVMFIFYTLTLSLCSVFVHSINYMLEMLDIIYQIYLSYRCIKASHLKN